MNNVPISSVSLCLFTLLIAFYSNQGHAFLNIEVLRQDNDELSNNSDEDQSSHRFKGATGVRFNHARGNVQRSQLRINTLNYLKLRRNNFLLLAQYKYGNSFSKEDMRQGHAHFRYTRELNPIFGAETYTQMEFNKFQYLSLRALIGSGLRIKTYKREKHSLFIGAGAFYERENLDGVPDPANPRSNFYLSYLWKNQSLTLSSTVYYQPNIEDFNDARFRFSTGIETLFLGKFTQQLEYTLAHDSRPPTSVKKTDARISAGLAYRY